MNKVELMGRLVADPEISSYGKGKDRGTVAKYTLAVQSVGDSDNADFIPCTVFGGGADFAEKYLSKGMKIAVVGEINTSKYEDKEGQTRYSYSVIVREHYFCESKKDDKKR